MIRAYKYKMKPTKVQAEYTSECSACRRVVYDHALKGRIYNASEKADTIPTPPPSAKIS